MGILIRTFVPHVLGKRMQIYIPPQFHMMAILFVFAVTTGAAWEIFEFSMDLSFGLEMLKPMLGDPSGLTDTISNMVVNTLGATVIAVLGYFNLTKTEDFWLERWIHRFIESNPRLFGKGEK